MCSCAGERGREGDSLNKENSPISIVIVFDGSSCLRPLLLVRTLFYECAFMGFSS